MMHSQSDLTTLCYQVATIFCVLPAHPPGVGTQQGSVRGSADAEREPHQFTKQPCTISAFAQAKAHMQQSSEDPFCHDSCLST